MYSFLLIAINLLVYNVLNDLSKRISFPKLEFINNLLGWKVLGLVEHKVTFYLLIEIIICSFLVEKDVFLFRIYDDKKKKCELLNELFVDYIIFAKKERMESLETKENNPKIPAEGYFCWFVKWFAWNLFPGFYSRKHAGL